jgi:hypothetical protein
VSPQKSTETTPTNPLPTGAPYRKPRADLYTALLVIALVAILIGILFLYLEMDFYEFKIKGGPVPMGMVNRWSIGGSAMVAINSAFGVRRLAFHSSLPPGPSALLEHGCSDSKTS